MTELAHRVLLVLFALVLTLFTSAAHAVGSVAIKPGQTVYRCYSSGPTYGAPFLADQAAACAAFFALASQAGRDMEDKTVVSGDGVCAQTTSWSLSGTTFVRTVTNIQRAQGYPPGWCGGTHSDYGAASFNVATRDICPTNATGFPSADAPTACTCDGGFKPDSAGTACVPDCTKGSISSSGFYDIGPDATANPVVLGCKGKCQVVFGGSCPAGAALVGGVKHWFCKGAYFNTGDAAACPSGSTDIGDGADSKPADTCGPGQVKGEFNGKPMCVAGGDGKQTEESKDKSTKKTDTTTKTNADGSTTKTDTTTEVDSNGNKKTTVTTTTTRSDGTVTSETTTTGKAGGTSADGEESEDPEKTECEKNPSGSGCGGEASNIGELYTKQDKTLSSVLSAGRDAFMASPVGSAVGGFFVVSSSGACPQWQAAIPYFKTTLVIDQFCTPWASIALSLLKVALVVYASFVAFRVAVE